MTSPTGIAGARRALARNNYVSVIVDQPEEVVTGRHGIVVPPRQDHRFKATGVVESVGQTCRVPELRPGIRVLFPPYGVGKRTVVDRIERVALLDWEIIGWFDEG
jgi:hypothetical protein